MTSAPANHLPTSVATTDVISGLDAMRGVGAAPAKGFWADAWARVLKRHTAIVALTWISLIALFAVIAPLVANGHPLLLREIDAAGKTVRTSSPLIEWLTPTDWLLLGGAVIALPFIFGPGSMSRSARLAIVVVASVQAGLATALASLLHDDPGGAISWWATASRWSWAIAPAVVLVVAAVGIVLAFQLAGDRRRHLIAAVIAAAAAALALRFGNQSELVNFARYAELERTGQAIATYTLIPWSPTQTDTPRYFLEPMTRLGAVDPAARDTPAAGRRFLLGTDTNGFDVLSQLLHACRLSISIGLVSTGIAVIIGVTIGALMGYFGGWLDLVLFRVVEVFMAIPVLFLLIVAAAVLPRNTYAMMAIIGCVTWTSAARFTRAEFLKLRRLDFAQAATAVGLPLRSILFKHLLPNGVTPVLVDASFAIAGAILVEATLSFLGLGPDRQASWGKLLSSATSSGGAFRWWLAVFPGAAIFLTVLSYNLLGEAMRDAIDPKLRKAAH